MKTTRHTAPPIGSSEETESAVINHVIIREKKIPLIAACDYQQTSSMLQAELMATHGYSFNHRILLVIIDDYS